jgi:HK97 family phage portal protein
LSLVSSIRTFWGAVAGLLRIPGLQFGNSGGRGATAAPVTFDNALTVSAWWAGCRLLSETVAALPVIMYRTSLNSRVPNDMHPLWYLLNIQPNRYMTKVEFFECFMLNLVTSGNAYVAIERLGDRIVSLLPLMSAQMQTELLSDGTVIHKYYTGADVKVYSAQSIWHVKLFGNGIIGLSPLSHARTSLGVALAAENRVTAIYRNGGKPTGVLMVDKLLSPEQRKQIRKSMAELAEGNDDNLFVLEAGMKYQAVSMSPEDIELLASRRFQLEDLARFLGVPSVLINDTQGSTVWGSGIEQIITGFYKLNLRPYLERIENSARVHLLTASESRNWEFEFNFDALVRMTLTERLKAWKEGINGSVITPNEARAMEGWEAKPGGDQLLVQGAMIPLDQVRANRQTGVVKDGN